MNLKLLFIFALAITMIGCIQPAQLNTLTVQVNTMNAGPLEGAEITVIDSDGNTFENQTDSQGKTILHIPPGNYSVTASAEEHETETKEVMLSEDDSIEFDLLNITPCEEDWECTDWGECVEGQKQRKCTDNNECGTTSDKPEETKECDTEPEPECESDSDCDDQDPCTSNECVNGKCDYPDITECEDNDDCCPTGCEYAEDDDCPEPVECQVDKQCESNDPCIDAYCSQDGECKYADIASCNDDDDCCPDNCDYTNDNDCEECEEDWECDDWSDCEGDEKTRECEDQNDCGTEDEKPDETASCCEDSSYCEDNENCVDEECELKNCTEQQGDICTNEETCPEDYMDASDTEQCCPVSCVESGPQGDLYILEDSVEVSGVAGKGSTANCAGFGGLHTDNNIWFTVNSTFEEPVEVHFSVDSYTGENGAGLDGTGNGMDVIVEPGLNEFNLTGVGGVTGEDQIQIVIDSHDDVEETNENNNELWPSFSLNPIDLSIDSVSFSYSSGNLSVVVERDQVTEDCSALFLTLGISIDSSAMSPTLTENVGFGYQGDPKKALLEHSICSGSCQIENITVIVDYQDYSIESNENNNEFFTVI